MRSDMDDSITENRLQTKGIYEWVRNPMYSGWWIAFTGGVLMWHNVCMLILPVLDWIIMTVVLINTEEPIILMFKLILATLKKSISLLTPFSHRFKPPDKKKRGTRCVPLMINTNVLLIT